MKILINDNSIEIPESFNIDEALNFYFVKNSIQLPFAVALNGYFVSRNKYIQQKLKDGDCIDIVYPIAGG